MTFEIPTTLEIEDGTYPAVLESVQVKTGGTYGDFRVWSFLVEYKAADGTTKVNSLDARTSTHTGPKSKSYGWLTAINQAAPKAGETVEAPTGKRCLVVVTHNDKGFPQIEQVIPFVEPVQEVAGLPR